MRSLIRAALNRSRTVIASILLVLILGVSAYINIPRESDPDIPLPFVMVNIHYEGISPEDSARLLVKPVETELRGIAGIKEMKANAFESGATIGIEFEGGINIDRALADVRDKVDIAKADLPDGAEEPVITEMNASEFPAIIVNLAGNVPERTLLHVAQALRDDLESIPSVLSANMAGHREEVLEVTIDPSKLQAYGINQDELYNVVLRNNQVVAAGVLDTGRGRFSVKVPGVFESARDVLELPLKVDGDSVVGLGDVADIRRTFKDPETVTRVNGGNAVSLEVVKRSGTNIIETAERVRDIVALHQQAWPEGLTVAYTQDQSIYVLDQVSQLQNNVMTAVMLVAIVVIGTLGFRSAVLVGFAIPTSFLFGLLLLWGVIGSTLNQVVLFALVIGVGMLVDGAIVVTEYADRKMSEGMDRRDAYLLAAERMAWPITASVATTLAAFTPLLFWPGVFGEFMKYLPYTVIVTLTGSLIAALIFLPTLGSIFGKAAVEGSDTLKALAVDQPVDVKSLTGVTGVYARTLAKLIRHPFRIIFGSLFLLIGVWWAYASFGEGVGFMPEGDSGIVNIEVRARGNLSIQEKDRLVREVEKIVLNTPEVAKTYVKVGGGGGGGGPFGSGAAQDQIGVVMLELSDWRTRRPTQDVIADIRHAAEKLPGIHVIIQAMQWGPGDGKDIEIEIGARDPDLLYSQTEMVRSYLEQNVAGLEDIDDSRPLPGIEYAIKVDRPQAAKFGADITNIGAIIQLVTTGLKVGEYRPDDADDELDIRVRYPLSERSLDQLDDLRINTQMGLVPISNFITREARPLVATITRVDGLQVMTVEAKTKEGFNTNDQIIQIANWLRTEADINPMVRIAFKGEAEEQAQAAAFLGGAFLVALFLIAIILVTQFNSFYRSLLILSAIVMSTVGVVIGLLVMQRPFMIVMTGIGVIALAGIVVNNNIVLIDTYSRLRKTGMPPFDAIIRTGAQRLRPVLLTTVTTITGLLPMFLQLNIDFGNRYLGVGSPTSSFWVDLAQAMVFGLTFSTALTLVITPSLLAAPEVIRARYQRWRNRDADEAQRPTPISEAAE